MEGESEERAYLAHSCIKSLGKNILENIDTITLPLAR